MCNHERDKEEYKFLIYIFHLILKLRDVYRLGETFNSVYLFSNCSVRT